MDYFVELNFVRAKKVYITGTKNKVNIVPSNIPPKIVQPIWILASAPAPVDIARGTTPITIAKVVIKIGLKRSFAAAFGLRPDHGRYQAV